MRVNALAIQVSHACTLPPHSPIYRSEIALWGVIVGDDSCHGRCWQYLPHIALPTRNNATVFSLLGTICKGNMVRRVHGRSVRTRVVLIICCPKFYKRRAHCCHLFPLECDGTSLRIGYFLFSYFLLGLATAQRPRNHTQRNNWESIAATAVRWFSPA